MESPWTFFIGGKFYNITRDEGEIRTKFDMRVNFILNGLQKMPISELYKYSKMYVNMVLLGSQPSSEQKDKILWLLGVEKQKPEESIEVDEVAFEDVKLALTSETILTGDAGEIVTTSGVSITPLGEAAFIHIPGNDTESLVGQVVHNVVLDQSSDDGQTAGVVLQVAVEKDDSIEVIELKTCADSKCDEPAPVLVTSSEMDIGVIVNPITIEVVTSDENDEVFGDPSAKNAFLMPDMKCYNAKAGDDPEETMEECTMERFKKQHELAMKLRSTKTRNLVFKPIEDDPSLQYWADENRYGRILMTVRAALKPAKNKNEGGSVENLKEVVQRFFEMPTDTETMEAYRAQVLTTVEMSDGAITDFTPAKLMDILTAYDMEMFESNLEAFLKAGTLSIIFKWTDEDTPCGLDVQDGGIFTLEPSKKVFEKLPRDNSKHTIFGVTCTTPAHALLVFVESFIATIVYETCKLEDSLEDVADNIFGHSDTEVKFASPKPAPGVSTMSMRERLQKLQNADLQADIIITIKDIGRVILASARGTEKMTIKSIPGEGNVEITAETRSQPYENVTHIQDVPV